ncbi:discoidin domain-containing protein [Bacteroides sp. UBA939]|uniref:discoidin domain-containing protein n=1 Tax=Bacteroides sp. UBA939 TaxID=1946092 RepID=UPI0025C37B2C|nr:discoidin domain-containing protein [Bacteroides sp. UBA939]
MKKLSYLLSFLVAVILYGCAETEQPYVGYIVIERAVVESSANSTATITADTDISSPITIVDEGAEWCDVNVNGKEISITTNQANTGSNFRTTTVRVKCGYRETAFTVLQKYNGQQYLEYDWTKWTAIGSDVQANDGGGYPSLFSEDRTKFWHSQYSPANAPLPHWIVIDMKEELECAQFSIGRRAYGTGPTNYPSVKTMEIHASTDNENFTKVGGFTFALPWEAPDGTMVNGNSTLVPPHEDIALPAPVTARYIKLIITETNNTTGVAQVSFFKAYEKI